MVTLTSPKIAADDAHGRVAVCFHIPNSENSPTKLLAVTVKWILVHGAPKDPQTGEFFKYEGTHIIQ